MVFIGFSKAFNISEFKSISNDIGVLDAWVKMDPNNSHNAMEDFGLAFGNDKLYLVSRRNGTAVLGGIVSTLVNGTWQHKRFEDKLDEAQYHDELFTLAGRLFMLTAGEQDGRIVFNKLFAWDDGTAKWTPVILDVPDNSSFPRLERGPSRFISIDVPIQDGNIAYVVATDHEMDRNDSSTSFSSLEVAFDQTTGMPRNATLKFINRVQSDLGKAVIASARKDNILYALVATFTVDPSTAKISVDYALDLANNNTKVDGIKLDGGSIPVLDFTISGRIIQANDMLLILSPHSGPAATSLVWDLDLVKMKMQDVNAKLPDFNRVFVIDQKNMRLLTADLQKGAFAAKISA